MSVFNTVQMAKVASNSFDLSHDVKYSCEMGLLTPVLLQEVLPGDSFKIETSTLIRFAPMIAPVMHNIKVYTHYFFVPNRIVWSNWEEFISADLSKEVPPSAPFFNISRNVDTTYKGTLWDYFGLPVGTPTGEGSFPPISALPFAAYQAIYDEYYRDQNLQDSFDYDLANGLNSGFLQLRRRAWMHDYFTSALPFAQKGPAVDLPISGDAPVRVNDGGASPYYDWAATDASSQSHSIKTTGGDATEDITEDYLYADLSDVNATTINDLRLAIRLQEWFEKAARGGSRYIEQLMVHFQVRSSDARLNRPEFLGGSISPVIISEVLQTSSTDATTPQATMAGHGLSANSGKRVRYYAEEHGYIIGIQSITPTTAYQQGIPRHFSRQSWEDYAWPTFAHLGEQAILNQELYDSVDGLNEETFGYIPRYSEYRYTPSRVAGEFRDSLAFWHLGRIFENRPTLNSDFIQCTPSDRIFAVESEPQNLWCHSHNRVTVRRKLPKYGTPVL